MRWLPGIFVLTFSLSLGAPARAQADEPPAPAEAEPAKAPILVLPLQAKVGVEAGITELLDDKITVELSHYPDFDVLARSDVQQMLELEAERSALGCDLDSNSCLAEVAGAMGAQYVVSGRMGKLGSKFVLTLNLYDSHKAANISRLNFDADALDKTADALPRLVADLVQPLLADKGLRGKAGAPVMTAVEQPTTGSQSASADQATANDDDDTTATSTDDGESQVAAASTGRTRPPEGDGISEAEDGLGVVWWLIPAGIVGVGALGLAGGMAVDGGLCFGRISCNGYLDEPDFVGPLIMLGGVGTLGIGAATALVFLFL